MKNSILSFMVMLFWGGLFVVCYADDPDMDAIMNANAMKAVSNVRHDRWVFETVGTSFQVYMFARKSAHPINNLIIKVGAGPDNLFPSTTSYGNCISYGCAANQDVQISIRNSSNDVFPAGGWDADDYCHVKVLGFPGFDKTGISTIPSGLWLGWEDARNHTNPYDYNDFCIVLVGCRAMFLNRDPVFDNTWTRTEQKPHNINMPNRIMNRKIEDKY
jgi:hypothetical protein